MRSHHYIFFAQATWVVVCALLSLATFQCTESELELVFDNRISLKGEFCTQSSDELKLPVKVLFVVDISFSMNINDPVDILTGHSRRAIGVQNAISQYCEDDTYSFGIIRFTSDDLNVPGPQNLTGGFLQCDPENPLAQFQTSINQLDVGLGMTPYISTLAMVKDVINADIVITPAELRPLTQYAVVFFSDGEPCHYDPNNVSLLMGEDFYEIFKQIDTIIDLEQLVGGITLSTAYLGNEVENSCNNKWTDDIPTSTDLLQNMATHGRGVFQQFDSADDIDFLELLEGSVFQAYDLVSVIVSNRTARLEVIDDEIELVADSDMDGLADVLEQTTYYVDQNEGVADLDNYRTDPAKADTDGDGCRDGIEAKRGFWPLTYIQDPLDGWSDPCKPPEGKDADPPNDRDGDYLWDLEETRIAQTSKLDPDTDRDGIPDGLEALFESNPLNDDIINPLDQDEDGITNWYEVRAHTMSLFDEEKLLLGSWTKYAYRYDIPQSPEYKNGKRCYQFQVDNISLVETIAAEGHEAGENLIDVFFIQKADGRKAARPIIQRATYKQTFFIPDKRDPDIRIIEKNLEEIEQDIVLLQSS